MTDAHAHLWSRLSRRSTIQGTDVSAIHLHLGKSIPWFYGTGVMIGVPFLSMVQPTELKLWFALLWSLWSILYLWLSQRELEAHARKFGSLSEEEVNDQTGDPWKVWIGVLLAIVIWGFGIVGHWSWPSYGPIEGIVLLCSAAIGFIEKYLTNAWILRYQAAVAGQKRYEEETRS